MFAPDPRLYRSCCCSPTSPSIPLPGTMTSYSLPILDLPVELFHIVLSHLPNRDIKSLRLVSKRFCDSVQLRLCRVALSANPLKIKVFRALADHEKFRHKITEIIWDDARLFHNLSEDLIHPQQRIFLPNTDISDNEIEALDDEDSDRETFEDEDFEDDDSLDYLWQMTNSENFKWQRCPPWFKAACIETLERMCDRRQVSPALPRDCPSIPELRSTVPPLSECWEYYRLLINHTTN